jgi:hypothetical protein
LHDPSGTLLLRDIAKPQTTKPHAKEVNMKKLVRNIMVLVLGLLFAGSPVFATTWNVDISVYGSLTYLLGGGSVSAPSTATIGWYAYAYATPGTNAAARVTVYMDGNQLVLDESQYANGNKSSSQAVPRAGTVNCYLEAWQSDANVGNAGCGVTVGW